MAERINPRSNTAPPARVVHFLAQLQRNRQAKVLAEATAKEAKQAVTRLNGERTAIFNQADDEGFDKEAVMLLDEWSQRGTEDLNRLLENTFKYARVAEVPIYREPTDERPQGDLWASDAERQQALDDREAAEAESEGCIAGLDGVDIDSNPHPVASLKFQSWAKGHAIGAGDRSKRGAAAPKAASAARKPGRPAKAAAEPAAPKHRGRPPKKPKIDAAAPDADVAADKPPFSASDAVH
jgi:hypothetical protein